MDSRSALLRGTEAFFRLLPPWPVAPYMLVGAGSGLAVSLVLTAVTTATPIQPTPTQPPVAAVSLPTQPPGATAAPTRVPTPRPTPRATATPLRIPDPAPARAPAASPFIFVRRASSG